MQKRKTDSKRLPGAILLDTHTAIWLADDSPKLRAAREILQIAYKHNTLFMSIISAWEIGMLTAKGRLVLSKSPLVWFEEFVRSHGVNILEITTEIAINSSYLPGDLHGDPADRIIVATAAAGEATIITADEKILSYAKKGFVNAIAC